MDKIIEKLIESAEDLKQFDEHIQNEVQKYSTKQIKKAFIAGACAGLVLGWLIG